MSETYLKCSCRACDGHIEFPSHAVGRSVPCPHCGATTDLYAPPPMPGPQPVAPPPMNVGPASPPPLTQAPRLQVQGASAAPPVMGAVPRPPGPPSLQVARPPTPPPIPEVPDSPEVSQPAVAARGPVNWMGWSLAGVSVVLFLVGGALYLNNLKEGKSVLPQRTSVATPASKKATPKPDTESQTESSSPATIAKKTATPSRPKSADDLKAGPIALKKTPGSSLVYAIGTVRNESDYQRFGVKIELDLLNAEGKRIGGAQDYAQVIEPRRDWRFRALVVAPRTASVRLAKIKEDE